MLGGRSMEIHELRCPLLGRICRNVSTTPVLRPGRATAGNHRRLHRLTMGTHWDFGKSSPLPCRLSFGTADRMRMATRENRQSFLSPAELATTHVKGYVSISLSIWTLNPSSLDGGLRERRGTVRPI